MKSFRQYLTESVKTFKYRIKLVGEPDSKFLDLFQMNLGKFDPVKMSDIKRTPIQKDPYGFPGVTNQPIVMFDIECRYPCTEPMIKQMAKLCGWDENLVRAIQTDFDDSINVEMAQYANEESHTPILDHEQLEDAGALAQKASKEYSESYLNRPGIQPDPADPDYEFTVAGGKTAPGVNTAKAPGNQKSPMTQITRPALPKTGAR